MIKKLHLQIFPLEKKRWNDFVSLFGEKGACGGCWCMYWRLTHSRFDQSKGQENKKLIHQLVENKQTLGLLAYDGKTPIGWCALSPRVEYIRLEKSRVLAKVDDKPVWSIPCFYVDKSYRNQGITLALILAAIEYCRQQGGEYLEAYPIDAGKKNVPPVFAYTGLLSAFQKAGFKEIARRSPSRPIIRYRIL